jgi:NAD+ kinase
MITIDTFLNDEYFNSYWADGLIFQPNRTGYPKLWWTILTPDKSLVITPIAPHNLNARPR